MSDIKTRQSKMENALERAKVISKRATCLRLKVGVVIMSPAGVQLSDGYNGAPRGVRDCLEKGFCLRNKLKIPHGTRYELCCSVHGEQNAIINAALKGVSVEDGEMFIWAEDGEGKTRNAYPCFICKKIIVNAGMKRVIVSKEDGSCEIMEVADWIDYWQTHDIIDDKQQYGVERNKEEKL